MKESKPRRTWRDKLAVLVESPIFINTIMVIILINAALVGIETYPAVYQDNQHWFYIADRILLWIFTVEIILRIIAFKPSYRFFKNPWNWFDFLIVFAGHIFAGAHFVTVLRILRVLRVLRAISIIPSLKRLVDALLLTIPSLGNIMFLMSIFFYIYAVIGTMLYQDIEPEYFGNLQLTLLTLFQVVTLESWASGVMRPVLEQAPMSWFYFVSFVLIGTFIIFNLFIGVIVSNVEKADNMEKEAANGPEVTTKELQKEIQELKQLITEQQKDRNR
ncbi:ion transporter [Sinobaca sp. H24]|uniref:ion transporter n=1 Tax=Sinobaca sp. H24 TaxID=2923376 RepID=UPI00207A3F94|nr:ion transporter [Sinobaca sp. H24]